MKRDAVKLSGLKRPASQTVEHRAWYGTGQKDPQTPCRWPSSSLFEGFTVTLWESVYVLGKPREILRDNETWPATDSPMMQKEYGKTKNAGEEGQVELAGLLTRQGAGQPPRALQGHFSILILPASSAHPSCSRVSVFPFCPEFSPQVSTQPIQIPDKTTLTLPILVPA